MCTQLKSYFKIVLIQQKNEPPHPLSANSEGRDCIFLVENVGLLIFSCVFTIFCTIFCWPCCDTRHRQNGRCGEAHLTSTIGINEARDLGGERQREREGIAMNQS